MVSVRAEGLAKKFRRRKIPAPPTLKEQVVNLLTGGGRSEKETFWALKDVNFQVESGEMLGVVGSNGSGKSTLLKLLAGIYRPDDGTLHCRGRVTSLIELGAGFHPELTGRENILINGLLLGLGRPEIRERFDDIIRFSGLEKFIDSPIRTYSAGMYMRLGFSIAAYVSPDVLLVDEILSVGDESFQHQCLGKINQFRSEGKTIIYVSHDLGSVGRLCDRVMWLEKGRIMALGEPKEVIDAYLDLVDEMDAARLMAAHHHLSVESLSDGGKRWGSGELSINSVRFYDSSGEENYLFHTGDKLSIKIRYEASTRLDDIIFGVAFLREDGVSCYGTNTRIDQVPVETVRGKGEITFEVENLNLLEGAYFLNVAAHREDGYPYDYHSKVYRFEVRSNIKDSGICRLPHRWIIG
jgi:ABC-type polysaccharide/polyol phosphate transport system ATPase subunit